MTVTILRFKKNRWVEKIGKGVFFAIILGLLIAAPVLLVYDVLFPERPQDEVMAIARATSTLQDFNTVASAQDSFEGICVSEEVKELHVYPEEHVECRDSETMYVARAYAFDDYFLCIDSTLTKPVREMVLSNSPSALCSR